MSSYKDQWNERYIERLDECLEAGLSQREAEYQAERHADGLIEDMYDHADMLRKQAKGE
jgi:hypothetical protein